MFQADGVLREGACGRCLRPVVFHARVSVGVVPGLRSSTRGCMRTWLMPVLFCFIRMKAIFYVHERVLQLHRPIATGILRGLACQATKKKQLQS